MGMRSAVGLLVSVGVIALVTSVGVLRNWDDSSETVPVANKEPVTFVRSNLPSYTRSKTASLAFYSDETPVTFRCSLDGAPFRACSSEEAYAGLSDGEHTLKVKAIDSDGNADQTPAALSWTVDSNAPLVTDVRPAGRSTTKDRTPTVSATVRDAQLDLSASSIKLMVDGRQISGLKYNRDTNRLSYTPSRPLSYGRHTVSIKTEDTVGLDAYKSWSFKVVR